MNREIPLVPELNFGIADVRDIALAHVRAMTIPEAAGKVLLTIVYSGCVAGQSFMLKFQEINKYPRGHPESTR